jgi:hypothetical protein
MVTVDDLGKLRERLQAVLRADLRDVFSAAAAILRRLFLTPTVALSTISCASSREYHTSRVRIPAKPAIAVRYAATEAAAASPERDALNPLSRDATTKLAASRARSYSNGPGSVSSKSFRSKTRVRAVEA